MRRDTQPAHLGDEVGGVVAFVRARRQALAIGQFFDHRDGCLALGSAGRRRHLRRHHQAVAVLHHHMSHVAQPGCRARDFLYSLASGSVVEACVSLLRFSP
jgi:hypothetical protein